MTYRGNARRFYVFDIELTDPDRYAQVAVEGRSFVKAWTSRSGRYDMIEAFRYPPVHGRFNCHGDYIVKRYV